MNRRKEVVRMAKDAGLGQHIPADRGLPGIWVGCDLSALERFAALVAAAERERCAKACEGEKFAEHLCQENTAYNLSCDDCAEAIRALKDGVE